MGTVSLYLSTHTRAHWTTTGALARMVCARGGSELLFWSHQEPTTLLGLLEEGPGPACDTSPASWKEPMYRNTPCRFRPGMRIQLFQKPDSLL